MRLFGTRWPIVLLNRKVSGNRSIVRQVRVSFIRIRHDEISRDFSHKNFPRRKKPHGGNSLGNSRRQEVPSVRLLDHELSNYGDAMKTVKDILFVAAMILCISGVLYLRQIW
jgi:hypothetical protein